VILQAVEIMGSVIVAKEIQFSDLLHQLPGTFLVNLESICYEVNYMNISAALCCLQNSEILDAALGSCGRTWSHDRHDPS
jgi:hypothetical protein